MRSGFSRSDWEDSYSLKVVRFIRRFIEQHPRRWFFVLTLLAFTCLWLLSTVSYSELRRGAVLYPNAGTVRFFGYTLIAGAAYLALLGFSSASAILGEHHRATVIVVAALSYTLAVEGSLRAYAKGCGLLLRPHPILGYEPAPNNPRWGINSLGLHGAPIELAKREREFRVLVLGDSCVFGSDSVMAYCQILEGLLQARAPGCEVRVLNAGVQGYSILTCSRAYRLKYRQFHPDVVIAACALDYYKTEAPESQLLSWTRTGELRSYLYRCVTYMCLRNVFMNGIFGGRVKSPPAIPESQLVRRLSDGEIEASYWDLAEACRQSRAQPVFLAPPIHESPQAADQVRLNLKALAAKSGAHYLDAHTPFMALPEHESLFVRVSCSHLNPEGHAALAQIIDAYLAGEKLAPGPVAHE